MLNHLYQGIEEAFAWFDNFSKRSCYSYCELESADDEHTLIAKDGSLLTIIELSGVNQLVANAEYQLLSTRFLQIFTPVLRKKGHVVKCVFRYDPAAVFDEIKHMQSHSRITAMRLGLGLDKYFSHRQEHLSQHCSSENVYLCLWTTLDVLSSAQKKTALNQRSKNIKVSGIKIPSASQQFLHVLPELRLLHQAMVANITEALNGASMYNLKMTVEKALNVIKGQLESHDPSSKRWQACMPGDPFYFANENDPWPCLWPSFSKQLFQSSAENLSTSDVVLGEFCYAPMVIELFPKNIKPFYSLFSSLTERKIPWQISFNLSANGADITKTKAMMAQFLAFSSHDNRLICNAHNLLKNIKDNSDIPVTKFSVSLMTWAPKSEVGLLREQKSILQEAIQAWGGAQAGSKFGDPMRIVCSTMLGIDRQHVPGVVGCPLNDAVKLMPLFRPAQSWQQGSAIFKTPDGKPWPYQSGSSKQTSWVELIYARSGAGKSVLLNVLNMSVCTSAGLDELPYISILDIGESSLGLIQLLQSQQTSSVVAQHCQFNLSVSDAINPFDTHLGARYPGAMQQDFLVNFLSILMLENIEDALPEGVTAMLTMIVDLVYRNLADENQPKIYHPGIESDIDCFLSSLALERDKPLLTWWQIVDYLFENDQIELALRAQRRASPLLSDLINAAHHSSVRDLYDNLKLVNGETYIQYFCRTISGCIRSYPGINVVTKLSVSARVSAFDLSSVVSSGNGADNKKSAIAYMLVRHATSSRFYLKLSDIVLLPPLYKVHHEQQIREMLNIPKRIVFDEFHRTSGCLPIRQQTIKDMREGRKHNVQITLASQSLADFDTVMLEFATSIFILSCGNQQALEQTTSVFGLNPTESHALQYAVNGPGKMGMNFIAQFHTKTGVNTQLLNLNLSAYELWAFTTTSEDVFIRQGLCEYLTVSEALLLLAKYFPEGTAKSYLEMQVKLFPQETVSSVAREAVRKMAAEYATYATTFQSSNEVSFLQKEVVQ